MRRSLQTLVTAAIAWCLCGPSAALNVLVVGEDASAGAVSRCNAVYRAVEAELVDQFDAAGHDVYDASAVRQFSYLPCEERVSDDELVRWAKQVQRPAIDLLLLFNFKASVEDLGHRSQALVSGGVRVMNLRTDARFAGYELDGFPSWGVPRRCQQCVEDQLADYAEILATDIGGILAEVLEDRPADTLWTFLSKPLSAADRARFEAALADSRGAVELSAPQLAPGGLERYELRTRGDDRAVLAAAQAALPDARLRRSGYMVRVLQ